jgi:hypothetical protein
MQAARAQSSEQNTESFAARLRTGSLQSAKPHCHVLRPVHKIVNEQRTRKEDNSIILQTIAKGLLVIVDLPETFLRCHKH